MILDPVAGIFGTYHFPYYLGFCSINRVLLMPQNKLSQGDKKDKSRIPPKLRGALNKREIVKERLDETLYDSKILGTT